MKDVIYFNRYVHCVKEIKKIPNRFSTGKQIGNTARVYKVIWVCWIAMVLRGLKL